MIVCLDVRLLVKIFKTYRTSYIISRMRQHAVSTHSSFDWSTSWLWIIPRGQYSQNSLLPRDQRCCNRFPSGLYIRSITTSEVLPSENLNHPPIKSSGSDLWIYNEMLHCNFEVSTHSVYVTNLIWKIFYLSFLCWNIFRWPPNK